MALTETQQITELIKKSKQILLVFPKDFSLDAAASALALSLVLKKMNKLADIVSDGFVLPKNLSFLSGAEKISSQLNNLEKFIITVGLNQNELEELSYNMEGDKLKIYLTPKTGAIDKKNVGLDKTDYKYDLIIALDSPDLESLGKPFQNFPNFFYETTIVNLDHHSENEQYGQINLTNPNAVATAEILFNLINEIDKNLLDEEVATCLLTGLVAKTKSFKTPNVTPKTMEIASLLLAAGAERQAIVQSLYRSRSLATLNLWGRVLARLKSTENNRLVWSLLTENDFVEAQADKVDLPDVIDELISFIPGVEVAILIYQQAGKTSAFLKTLKTHNALYLTADFKPEGNKNTVEFFLADKSLREAEKEVIDAIKDRLGEK